MEKKEKKADLEQLLNTLIERGWKPFGIKNKILHVSRTPDNMIYFDGGFALERCYDFRQLTSKESGLWQFVCENGMINEEHKHERILDPTFGEGWADCKRQEHDGKYGYRLIESALKDESELEEFLLSNIKIGN